MIALEAPARTDAAPRKTAIARVAHRAADRLRTCRIAFLGCGTVGSRAVRELLARRSVLADRFGIEVELVSILVRTPQRHRACCDRALSRPGLFTNDFDDVLDAKPDVVIELLGGVEPAAIYVRRALDAGIHAVTANKTLIAHHGEPLAQLAAARGVRLEFEAAVAAALPLVSTLRQLRSDRVYSIKGILNGSTNYILSRMFDKGLSMTDALREAADHGLIEPDPSADLSGRDAAEKLAIIARELGCGPLAVSDVEVKGIQSITVDDVLTARRLGYALKLVAELATGSREEQAGDSRKAAPRLRVGPALLPKKHRLAGIRGAENGIIIDAELAGEIFLAGQGAGPAATTSAILGDLARILDAPDVSIPKRPLKDVGDTERTEAASNRRAHPPHAPRPHFLRITLSERIQPRDLFEALRQNGVGVRQVDIHQSAACILTSEASPSQLENALAELGVLEGSLVAPVVGDYER